VRFVVLGAGAIGGAIGARLFQHGHEVQLIARGEHLEALRKDGLLFETPEESVRLPIPTAGSPAELDWRPDDVVILAVKSQQTAAALDALRAAAGSEVPVVCAQNGVANERMAARRFRDVYGMVVFLPASHMEPGVVQAQSRSATGVLDSGRYPEGRDERIDGVCAALDASRCSARPDARIMRWKYAKLLRNLGNAAQACCGQTEEIGDIVRQARAEALRCFEAGGIEIADRESFRERMAGQIEAAPIRGSLRGGGSTWQSVARGTGSVEVDYLNGEIVLLGAEHGVPTPANAALQAACLELAHSRAPAGSVAPAALYARLKAAPASVR
jgi:2-dehydropantoate 2-reductase